MTRTRSRVPSRLVTDSENVHMAVEWLWARETAVSVNGMSESQWVAVAELVMSRTVTGRAPPGST
jgi:hypothetical protein